MADHTTNTATSVDSASSVICAPKMQATGTVLDSDQTAAFNIKVLNLTWLAVYQT